MKVPEILSTRDLTLDQACSEYVGLRDAKSLGPEYGWSRAVTQRIDDRLDYLRTVITDAIITEYERDESLAEFYEETKEGL